MTQSDNSVKIDEIWTSLRDAPAGSLTPGSAQTGHALGRAVGLSEEGQEIFVPMDPFPLLGAKQELQRAQRGAAEDAAAAPAPPKVVLGVSEEGETFVVSRAAGGSWGQAGPRTLVGDQPPATETGVLEQETG